MFKNIPKFVIEALEKLKTAGFEAFIVGGCVRDILMDKVPVDWDITTSARPEDVLKIFGDDAKYENRFGTVLVPIRDEAQELLDVLEITTYRSEGKYSDARHPDEVQFEDSIDKDLERRDFTINALALDPLDKKAVPVDLFGGVKDIQKKIIRAVGEPIDRFKEDALRMMRAVRFYAQLGFDIEPKTERGISKMAGALKFVAKERIRDELIKILKSDQPADGFMKLHNLKLLNYIIPELEDGVTVKQHYHHIYPVFKHNVLSLKYCPSSQWQVRLASLLHDVGKPRALKYIDDHASFYNHEYIGAKMTRRIMERLRFSVEDTFRVVNLVRNHMFYYNVGEVSAASVRRLIAKTGRENLSDLIDIRIADRLGSGLTNGLPYKLKHLQYMMDKVQNDPVSVKMLSVNGDDLMTELKIKPSPKIGALLDVLLAEVLDNPEINTREQLLERAKILNDLDLVQLRDKAKWKIQEERIAEDRSIKRKFGV